MDINGHRLDEAAAYESSPSVPTKVRDFGLTVLVEPETADVDVVFVHGLTGHPRRTWTCTSHRSNNGEPPSKVRRLFGSAPPQKAEESEGVFWPADLLRKSLPSARILTYGYDSNIRHVLNGRISQSSILDLGHNLMTDLEAKRRDSPQRPLLFVAHSLGGVVVKEALRKSEGSREYQTEYHSVFESTIGIMFFGTPHRGADPQSVVRSVSENVARITGYSVNSQLVDGLLPSSERLKELREEFSKMTHSRAWRICSFQELYGIQLLNGRKVVEDESSSLDDPKYERKQHIAGDHMRMCRFGSRDDAEFEKVVAAFDWLHNAVASEIVDRPTTEHIQECLSSLSFEQIDSRLLNIRPGFKKTCEWLLKEPEYLEWLDQRNFKDHHGLLWIKGYAGVGKSTVMKHAFTRSSSKRKGSDKVTLSYFFNARGAYLEKSTIGMYRSLVRQMLTAVEDFQRLLMPRFVEKCRWSEVEWTIAEMQDFLNKVFETTRSQSFMFFIDALDEANEDDIREMLEFFEQLCELAIEHGTRLNICFSSRHYPTISVRAGSKIIVLEERSGHGDDIRRYIEDGLNRDNSNLAKEIKTEVQERAKGSFIWVNLVVKMLKKDFDRGNVSNARKRLDEVPGTLDGLFMDILKRNNEDVDNLVLLLQWVLFAQRPLTPVELYIAVVSWKTKEAIGTWASQGVSDEHVERFLINCSKGLVQIIKAKTCNVQFIHETVRDFLLRNNGLARFQPSLSSSTVGRCHDQLKASCLKYLTDRVFDDSWPPQSPYPVHRARLVDSMKVTKSAIREKMKYEFPFTEYAIYNLFAHAEASESSGISQAPFLERLHLSTCKDFGLWLAFYKIFEAYRFRGRRRFSEDIESSTMFCFSRTGRTNLIQLEIAQHDRIPSKICRELHHDPVVDDGDIPQDKLAKHCLDLKNSSNLFGITCAALQREQFDIVDMLVQEGWFWKIMTVPHRMLLLRDACAQECLSVVDIVLKECIDTDEEIRGYEEALQAAAQTDHIEIAQRLIDRGVDVKCKDKDGKTVLSLAALKGRRAMVRLFLQEGVDVNARSNSGITALEVAANRGDENIVKQLLEAEADANLPAGPLGNETLLGNAVRWGRRSIAALLLDGGAITDSKDSNGSTPLHLVVERPYDVAFMQKLLEKGPDMNAKNGKGWTPLHIAAQYWILIGNARLLIQYGADINARDWSDKTPLYYATRESLEMVDLLIENGASINTRNERGETPLHFAVQKCGSLAILELLLEKGADINAEDSKRRTPLHSILVSRYSSDPSIVSFLVENGSNVNARDLEGETPLHCVVTKRDNGSIIALLLSRGASISARNARGLTTLELAESLGPEHLATMSDVVGKLGNMAGESSYAA